MRFDSISCSAFLSRAFLWFLLFSFGPDFGQQYFSGILIADQFGMLLVPSGSELATVRLGENGLGEMIDAGLSSLEAGFDLVGESEEFFYPVDDFGLFRQGRCLST